MQTERPQWAGREGRDPVPALSLTCFVLLNVVFKMVRVNGFGECLPDLLALASELNYDISIYLWEQSQKDSATADKRCRFILAQVRPPLATHPYTFFSEVGLWVAKFGEQVWGCGQGKVISWAVKPTTLASFTVSSSWFVCFFFCVFIQQTYRKCLLGFKYWDKRLKSREA